MTFMSMLADTWRTRNPQKNRNTPTPILAQDRTRCPHRNPQGLSDTEGSRAAEPGEKGYTSPGTVFPIALMKHASAADMTSSA